MTGQGTWAELSTGCGLFPVVSFHLRCFATEWISPWRKMFTVFLAFVLPALFHSPLQQPHRDLTSLYRSSPQVSAYQSIHCPTAARKWYISKALERNFPDQMEGHSGFIRLAGVGSRELPDEYLPSLQLNEFTERKKRWRNKDEFWRRKIIGPSQM